MITFRFIYLYKMGAGENHTEKSANLKVSKKKFKVFILGKVYNNS